MIKFHAAKQNQNTNELFVLPCQKQKRLESALMRDLLSNDDTSNMLNNNNHTNLASLEAELDLAMQQQQQQHQQHKISVSELVIGGHTNIRNLQPQPTLAAVKPTIDLWSSSLSQLEDDFLKADQAKKQTKQEEKKNTWDKIDDYEDVGIMRRHQIVPPPPLPPPPGIRMVNATAAAPPGNFLPPPGMTVPKPPPPPAPAVMIKQPSLPPGIVYPTAAPVAPGPATTHGIILHPATASHVPAQPQPLLLFNNPNPNAPPIPLKRITSSLMKPRDISYILFNLCRSIDPTNDYYFQLYYSFSKNTSKKQKNNVIEKNNVFRSAIVQKSKEWTVEKQVLGVVHKTDIHKPKALLEIAPFQREAKKKDSEEESTSQLERDRKLLWKCRIYIDDVYTQLSSQSSSLEAFQNNFFVNNNTWKECMAFEKGRKLVRHIVEQRLFPMERLPDLLLCIINWNSNRMTPEQRRLLQLVQHILYRNSDDLVKQMFVTSRELLISHFTPTENIRSLPKEIQGLLKIFLVRGKEVCGINTVSCAPQVYERWNRLEHVLLTLQ